MFCVSKRKNRRPSDVTLTWGILISMGIRHFHHSSLSIKYECGIPECEVLPPPPPVEEEEPLELFDLLARGSEFLDNYTDVSEAIVLLGNTGSGKSTLTQILAGNLSKLHSVLTSGCNAVIIDEDNKIGLPSTKSKTLFPELFFKTDPNSSSLAIYDFPGFDDTRGDVQDIAANFFMNQVITKISSVKMLFLVTHSSVNFNERKDFHLLATHAATFVKNLQEYSNSFVLVVTKVGSYNGMGRYIEDSTIISGIVEFLSKFLDELRSQHSSNPGQDAALPNKILFVETLLHQDPTSGNYDKIWFVRSPLDCGPLSEQEMIHHTKNNITKLYDDLNYTGINAALDFGFTLKDETKLVIVNYTNSINSGISSAVDLVIKDLRTQHFKSGRLVDFDNLNFTSLNTTMHHNSLPVKSIVDQLQTNITTSTELSNVLKFYLRSLRYHVPAKFHSFMTWQEEYLTFFDKAVGESQERSVDKWAEPIPKLNEAFIDLVDWYEFCLVLDNHVSSYLFQSKKHDLPAKNLTDTWLNYIDTNQIVAVSRQIKEVASRIEHQHSNLLHVIMTFALDVSIEYCDPDNNAIVFEGKFIQLSKLPSPSSFIAKCGDKTNQVHYYAARTIFLDVDLNLVDFDLVMIAPFWTNPLETITNITLAGKTASHEYPKAASGSTDQPGSAGCMGVTGYPGCTMFGISSSTQLSYPVSIVSQGGKGGRGQEGGNGGPRSPMRNANHNSDPIDHHDYVAKYCWFDKPNIHAQWGFRGYDGTTGGNGGMPGNGGQGVNSNNESVVIFQGNDLLQFTSKQGENGLQGKVGSGGTGGSPGKGYYCVKHCTDGWECWARDAECWNGRCPGNPGGNGANGNSPLCPDDPIQPRELLRWPAIVNYRTRFLNDTDLATTTLFNEIDKRAETKNLFTLKALAEESLALGKMNRGDVKTKRLREMYTSLVSRLEDFSLTNYNKVSDEHKKIVNILLSLAHSSLMNFDRAQNYDVIVDISYYISIIERQVNSLRTSTSLQSILQAKETFTQNLKAKISQSLGLLVEIVTPAIEQAKEDLEIKVNLLEDQLVSLIEDTQLSSKEMKEKLRKSNEQQGILNFLKIFDVIGNIFSAYIPISEFPTWNKLVMELQENYSGSPEELERVNQLVEEAEILLEELEEKREEFQGEFQPLLDSLLGYFKNVSDSLNSRNEVERPQLLLTKWQVITTLKDVKNSLNVFGDESLNLRPLSYAIDRIQDAMATTIDMYEMIEEYLETASLAGYISTLNSAQLGPISITDPEYVNTVENFDIKIKQNLLDVEVNKANHAFKKWVFPFAKFYFGEKLRFVNKQNISSELGAEHLQQLENLQMELERYKAMSVGNQHTFIIPANFSSELKTSKPFFTWKSDQWWDNIVSLLSGDKTDFLADVKMQGMEGWEAIKFKLIEINFKLNYAPEGMQEEFDDILEYFGVSMTHSGVSYYRFQQDYFVMTGANQTVRYNFERDEDGNRLGTNQVYEKFRNGDFLLSPYTLWTFQLRKVVPVKKGKMLRYDVGFESLEKFLPYIDVELVGMGTYTDGEAALAAAYGDMQLGVYYERDERVVIDFKF